MAKYWCPVHILINWCLCCYIKIRVSVHDYQCALFIPKILLLPFLFFPSWLYFYYTQQLDSRQDHPISWTASGQQQYIAVPRHGHHPSNYSNCWPVLHPTPYPRTMKSKDGNTPPSSVPASATDISASTSDPSTVPTWSPSPSPTESLLSPRAKGTSWPNCAAPSGPVPGPPISERDHLRRKLRRVKREHRPLCPRLEEPAGQGQPRPPPLRRIPHRQSSARRGRRPSLLDHPDLRGEARRLRGTPPPGQLGAVTPLRRPLPCCPQW